MEKLTADQLKELLNLRPNPEGGFFTETVRSKVMVSTDRHHAADGVRSSGTTIYYLLTPESPNGKFCKNMSEIMHVWCGGGAQIHTFILPDGTVREHVLGPRIDLGQTLQVLCPAGSWKTSRLQDQDQHSLITEVVYPGWELCDFEMGRTDKLSKLFPQHKELIEKYTHAFDVNF